MKAYHIAAFENVEPLVLRTGDIPCPGEKEVLIKMHAASLNRRDISILQRVYPLPSAPDVIPLSDGAGEVIAMGGKVTRFKTGDRVCGTYFPRWRDGKMGHDIMDQLGCSLDGMLTEYAVLHEDWLVSLPAFLSWEEGSTLSCAALTAWNALFGARPLLPGNTVLTIGSGGVPLFAIQFAKLCGANVIALTTREEKSAPLKLLGADEVIVYPEAVDWHKQVLAFTAGRGVDKVIETGGAGTFEESVRSVCLGGELVLASRSLEPLTGNPAVHQVLGNVLIGLVHVRPIFVGNRLDFEDMARAILTHGLHPIIDTIFPFDAAGDAYQYFAKRTHLGKVVIRL